MNFKLPKIVINPALVITLLLAILLLFFTVKGTKKTYYDQSLYDTSMGSPFESSNNSSRYALTEAITNRLSFILTPEEAKFSSPDVAKKNNRYFSLFMPGVSVLGAPLFYIGKYLGFPQLTTYLLNGIISLVCLLFIVKISRKIGANKNWSIISGFLFIFSSNVWAYSLGYTQHLLTTLLVLIGLKIIQNKINVLNNLFLGVVFGAGLMVDLPNAIILLPIVIYQILRHFEVTYKTFKINWKLLLLAVGVVPFIASFIGYNILTTGSPLSPAQFLGRTSDFFVTQEEINIYEASRTEPKTGISLPFKSRKQLQGLYILIVSNERGILYYSPVLILGLFGFYISSKNRGSLSFNQVTLGIIGLNLFVYAMFGDPWGGWSFGPRYMIPATAVIMIYFPFFFESKKYRVLKSILMVILASYSIYLSSLGALTTSMVPPKQEAIYFTNPIPYTPQLNKEFIETKTSSLFYNLVLNDKISTLAYSRVILSLCLIYLFGMTIYANTHD